MEMAGDQPDVVIGCVGGGSNFAGLAFPFVRRVLRGETSMRFLAAVSQRVSRRANNHSSLRSPSQAMWSCGSTTLVRGQIRGYFRGLAVSVTRKRFSASSERKRRAVSALTAHVSYWLVTAMVAGLL